MRGERGCIIIRRSAQLIDKEHNGSDRVGGRRAMLLHHSLYIPANITGGSVVSELSQAESPNYCADERMHTQTQSHIAFFFSSKLKKMCLRKMEICWSNFCTSVDGNLSHSVKGKPRRVANNKVERAGGGATCERKKEKKTFAKLEVDTWRAAVMWRKATQSWKFLHFRRYLATLNQRLMVRL